MSNPVETPVTPAPEPDPERRLGPIGRARAALAAVETLVRLREDQAQPTPEDLATFDNWPGWGPLAPALADDREGTWSEIGEQLQRLLSPRDYRQAEQGTSTAFYTPAPIVDACWSALRDLNFTGGRLFEPGFGMSKFAARTPPGLNVKWFGIERDPTTAGIAALRYPNVEIINARLQDAGLQSNSVDAVLGNVPYGNFPVHDKTAPKAVTDSIHNYFIWRSVQALRPGGVAILLTSRYTMDSADDSARRAIAKHADLLGAVRLPNGALAEGGTGVLADILIVRRRDTDGPVDDSWMEVTEVPTVSGQYVNDYFHAHPEHVLGEFEQGRAAQYGHTLAVKPPEGQDLAAALGGAFDSITAAARTAGREWRVAVGAQPFTEDTLPFPIREDGRKEGSFHLVEGKPHEVIDGELVAVERAGKELPKLIALRDATLKLIEAETNHDTPDEQLEPLRAEVNRLYDSYVRTHGPINRFNVVEGQVDEETGEKTVSRRYPRLGGFRRDPDVVSVLALEDFDDETKTAHKAALLTRRVNRRIERPTSAETPEEALSLCLNFKNKIDVPTIAQLLGIEEDQVHGTLGDLVFPDPDTGELLTKGAYLSGEVVDKLERAEFLLSQGRDDLQRHVDELRQVQPEPLPPEDIKAKLGAPWIPVEDVTAFAEEMLGVRVDIVHVAKTATWSVDQPMTLPEAATSEWGTARVNAFELLDLALNGQAPKVYDTFNTPGGGSRRVRNDKETMLAESKQTALMRRFASWVWEDPDRADRLAADYNRIFNSWVLPKHDGSHLTVDGMDPEFKPYEHQWDFVQRVLSADEGSLCPYPVGAGKTATMFMTAVKLKQLGLVNKPMIVVPNHLLEQISRDGKKLFQNARILMAGKKDLADARSRMLFAARCATGDWDAIVMTHNSFGRLGVHPVTEATYLEELANEYRVALGAVDGDDGNQRRIKEIAKMVDRFDARASDLRSKAIDAGVTYENLGVDFLQVDEAHLFKNLALPATTEGMSLGKPSKRATDLDLKLIVTRERTGRENVSALYSGTFISNSVREMFVFKHYTMPKRLEKLGLASPDAWAANFIQFETKPEVGVDGVSFRLKRRPVEYTNADDALALFSEVAELRPPEAFKIKRPKRVDRFVEIDATPNLVNYVGTISDRIDKIQGGKVKPYEDNMLNVITDGRKAALDLELVGVEPDGPGKAGAIAKNVLEVYHRTKDLKLPGDPEGVAGGLQVLFCDLGTPSKDKGSQVYGKIRRYLIDGMPEEGLGGIPRERIKFIHDYNSDLAKEQLFTACRAGEVSVLFSSSVKGATGVNVQTRGVALHHADPPHRPDEWAQREGRLDRPGNKLIDIDMEVEFYRYLALNSFDSYMFQQLERKQRPIVQIMSGQKVGRVIQEIDPVGAGFGRAKAIVAGNPLLMDLADVNGELNVLLNEADGHRQAQARMKRKVEVLSETIQKAERDLPGMRTMADAVTAAGDDDTWRTADGRLIDPDDVAGVLAQTAQGSKPTLDLDAGYRWRGLNVGFTWLRKQQFNSIAYESWAHLVAGEHQVDVRLNLPWFGKGQAWRIVKALGDAADEAVSAPAAIEQKVAKQRAALEDTQSHIGRPFDKRAELEDVRARKEALEARISASAVSSGDESQDGPPFEPGAAGAEMTEAEMAMHDAAVMAGAVGGTVIVRSEGQIIGGARPVDSTGADPQATDRTSRLRAEILRVLTEAGTADSDVTAWAQIDANEGAPFREAFAEWAQEWAQDLFNRPEDRPVWLRAWLEPEAADTRRTLLAEAAETVWQQARAATDPEGPPAPEMVETAALLRYYEPLLQRHGVDGGAAAADYITRPGYGFEPDVRNPLYDLVARIDNAAGRLGGIDRDQNRYGDWSMVHVGLPRLEASQQLYDVSISLTNVMTGAGTAVGSVDLEAILAAPPGTVIDLPPLPESTPAPTPEAETNQDTDAQQTPPTPASGPAPAPGGPADPAPEPEESAPDTPAPPAPDTPPNEGAAAPTTTSADPPASPPGQAPLQDLIDTFGDRVMVGHIGGPQPARTHQSAGWAVMAVLSEDQVRGLVSAVAVDGQPVSMEPGVMPTDRVRGWIAEQQQAPTAAFFASTSSELPPALRGDGDVHLSARTDGLTIEQGDVTTTILWEELPAWIDAAVAHDSANRSSSLPAWRYGRLDHEIHFRRDERNQSAALALNALADALRETVAPTDEQLAEARDRYAPPTAAAPVTTTNPAVDAPAEESAPEESAQRLPEDASPVPGAEGYHYTEEGRTVRLYTEPGEEVGTAKWSYTKYRYLGDVNGDVVRGTEDGATVAKRMANHHAVVYGDKVHRPTLDDQGRDPVWILHNGSDTLVFGVSPQDDTAKAAMWTGGGFKESRKVGGWYLPRTWKEPTRRQRVDDAVRVLAAAGRTVTVHTTREERQQPPEPPARLPELIVTAPNLDEVPQFFNATPFTDQDDLADVQRLETAYARWGQHPTVRAYLSQDNDRRPDGFGTPDNPIAELHIAYHRARLALREPVPGGPDEIVRRVYGVAAWCQALEPVVEQDLLDPLQDLYAAAHGLAARSQATIAALTAEQAAAAEDAPAPAPEPQAPDAAQQESGTGDQPLEPAPAPSETTPAAAAEEQGPADPPVTPEPPVAPLAPAPDAAAEPPTDVAVPEGYQPFSDSSVELVPGDVVREGWRQYMEDRHLQYRTVVITEGPDPRDGYYICRHQNGTGSHRVHPREIVAVPDGSRLLPEAGAEKSREELFQEAVDGLFTGTDPQPGATDPEPEPTPDPAAPEQQLGLFGGDSTPAPQETPPDTVPAEQAPAADELAQLARVELTGAADIRYWMHGSMRPGEPETLQFHLNRQTRSYSFSESIFNGTRDECLAYVESAAAVRSAAEARDPGDKDGEQQAAAQAWLREAALEDPAPDPVSATDVPELQASDATDEEGQLDLFGEAAPAPAPAAQRPSRRRGRREPEPAVSPGTEGAPDGRLGVYGHADHGECERCGTLDTDRYTVVLHWMGPDDAEMAAECGPCVELTLGLPYQQYRSLADVAEARRDGVRIQPRPHPEGDEVVCRRTAENEWTSVHRPTGQRYRTAKETESGYRGFVTRELSGVSVGTGVSVGSIRELTERAALGRTAETHPNDSDDWVYFSYGQNLKELGVPEGETITARSTGARRNRAPLEHGPMWDLSIGGTDFTVEMVYQQGLPGYDGHRLAVTGPEDTSTRSEQWQGVLEWARERVRAAGTEQPDAMTAAPPAVQQETVQSVPDPEPEQAPADVAAAEESAAPDDTPAPDDAVTEESVQPEQEEAVAGEPEPTAVVTDAVPAVDPPADGLPAETPVEEEEVVPAVDVEDPPAPRTFAETAPLAADARYQLRLTSVEGEGLRNGELLYGEATIAAVRLSADGRWFAQTTIDGSPADVTSLNGSPQDAAHQGAIMFAVITGEPYGEPPVAADARGRLSRADVLRVELRTAAEEHLRTITVVAARANPNYPQNPQFQALSDQLGNLRVADIDNHDSRQMAANLTAVQEAVIAWGGALPQDPALDERQHFAFPLMNLLHETMRLHARLQATLEAVQADRAAAREQETAAVAPAEPAREDSEQQTPVPTADPAPDPAPAPPVEPPPPAETPGPEQDADATKAPPTDQPAPLPDAPEDTEMATPARPATPESPEVSGPDSAAEPGEEQLPADMTQREGRVEREPAAEPAAEPAPPAAAEEPELPLWTGPAETSGPEEDRPLDVFADFTAVQEAWDELVPAEKGTGADLFATVEDELQRLETLFADAVAKLNPPAEPQPAPEAAPTPPPATTVPPSEPAAAAPPAIEPEKAEADRDPQQSAAAVNTALREADAHAPALQDLPEWQRIQSVRGAFGHLMHVMKERAGEHFDKLMADGRVSNFVRRVSIKACDKVAEWATSAADKLRGFDDRGAEQGGKLPSAEALLRLGDAALDYRGPRRAGGGGTPPPSNGAADPANIPAMRKMGEALNKPLPGAKRGVSAAAARGRSTTTKRGKKPAPGGSAEQAGHLRRGGAEQQQARKPNQR
ncbi:hypothetical protein ACFYY1_37400 [Streptomyces sp. NPDC001890]|uniref:hypothetical protein n=1 Tax=Streptomyces sp. NPDC001890 TaxID=3364620 RepID=UPI003683FE00